MNTKIPKHLSLDHASGLHENEVIAQYELGSGKNFVYLILDWATKKAAIVDPQKDLSGILADLKKYDFELTMVLLTHTHFDHIAGLIPLLKLFPDLIVRVGKADLHRLSEDALEASGLKINTDGEKFNLGDLKLGATHTPGHSSGEFCYFLETPESENIPYLFTGDTIFIRDCGRTDFEDGSNEEMFRSIQRIKKFPPETVLLVGHHYAKECSTTLAAELTESGPFLVKTVDELTALP